MPIYVDYFMQNLFIFMENQLFYKLGNCLFIGVDFILKYVTKGLAAAKQHLESESAKEVPDSLADVVKYLEAVEKVKHSHDEHEVARLVEEHKLMREQVPTWFIKGSKEV